MSRRADGLLNHNYPGDDKGPQDACGVFGVWAPDEEVAKLTFYGLYALQHREQNLPVLQLLMGIASSSLKIWALSHRSLLNRI